MKKLLGSLLALTLVFGSAVSTGSIAVFSDTAITASAEDSVTTGEYDGWEYLEYDGKITVTAYTGNKTEVTIPSKINDKVVTSFNALLLIEGNWYGNQSGFYNTNVQIVNIPASIESIDEYAFWAGKTVTTINVDKNNKNYSSYDGMLFNKNMTELLDCPEGKKGDVKIPDSVTKIGSIQNLGAFEDCNEITNVEIPDSVTDINIRSFRACKSLKEINIPKNATYFKDLMDQNTGTYWCNSLERIIVAKENPYYNTLDNGAIIYKAQNENEENSFAYIPKDVESLHIPSGVNIDLGLLDYIKDIMPNVTLDEGVKYLDEDVVFVENGMYTKDMKVLIAYSRNADKFEIPDTVTTIESDAVNGNKNLKKITIPDNVRKIGQHAFSECDNLKFVTLPDIEKSTGDADSITYGGNIAYVAFGYVASEDLSKYEKLDDFIIFCNPGTDGERYAEENGFKHYLPGTVIEPDDSSSSTPDSSESENPDSSKNENSSLPDSSNSTSSKNDDNSKDSSDSNTNNSSDNKTTSSKTSNSSSTANKTNNSTATNPNTGAAAGLALAALGLGAVVVTKRRK